MSSKRSRRRSSYALGAAALAAVTAGAMAGSPTATAGAPPALHGSPGQVVATGLVSPRLLSFARDGSLYVAEAGAGGNGPCATSGDGSTVCLAMNGAITRIRHGHQRRIVRHLPSLGGGENPQAVGPADVLVKGHHLYISMGAGIDARARHRLGRHGRHLGQLLTSNLHHPRQVRVVGDVARFELHHNPDHSVAHDSDPTGFIRTGPSFVLADAGGNDLLRIHRDGRVHAMTVLPDRVVPMPPVTGPGLPPPGTPIPMQAVPTAVARHGHAFYISQLTGFPFPQGGANIYRMRPGHTPQVWASGLTNVTDLAWHRGHLYAVQLTDTGLLAAQGLPMGSLVRVHHGDNSTPDVVAGNLPAPYGVALRGGSAYVTTCSVCVGGGQVMRFPVS